MRAGALGWLAGVLLLASGCRHAAREELREQPLEAGLLASFSAPSPLRWDFGDGSPPVHGAAVRHAWARAGRYEVRGFAADALVVRVRVTVVPRSAPRLVPPDVPYALVVRGLEELLPAVDYAEALVGTEAVGQWLDAQPLLGWAVEQATGGTALLDAREGLALFAVPEDAGARAAVVGVLEPPPALEAFQRWLAERGWRSGGGGADVVRLVREERALEVFADRGALYAVERARAAPESGAQAWIAAAPAEGLEADGVVAAALDALPSGGLALYGRGAQTAAWRFATAALRLRGLEATLEGTLHAGAPLWGAPDLAGPPLLARAPEGPAFVAAAHHVPAEVVSLLLGSHPAPRRRGLAPEAPISVANAETVAQLTEGTFALAGWFDGEGFVRRTLAQEGRPALAGALLLEATVREAAPLVLVIEHLWQTSGLPPSVSLAPQLRQWRAALGGHPVELSLSERALALRAGTVPEGRALVDVTRPLRQRARGAFGPGHLSLFVDLGQLRQELLTPRQVSGVDPRRSLAVQAAAVTVLDRLTRLDEALFDLGPSPQGAALHLSLSLREAPPEE